jgi:hypothetical protein
MDYLVIPEITREDQIEGLSLISAFSILYGAAAKVFLSGDKQTFGTLIRAIVYLRRRDLELGKKYAPKMECPWGRKP